MKKKKIIKILSQIDIDKITQSFQKEGYRLINQNFSKDFDMVYVSENGKCSSIKIYDEDTKTRRCCAEIFSNVKGYDKNVAFIDVIIYYTEWKEKEGFPVGLYLFTNAPNNPESERDKLSVDKY